jgi:hypothetical protein
MRMEMQGPAGVPVLTLYTRLDEAGDRYRLAADYATSGIAKLMVDIRTHAEASGRLTPASAMPEAFHSESRRNGVDRHNRVDYRPDGTLDGGSTPPLPQPISAQAMRGTIDNLTAYLRLERQLARGGDCALTVPVFDGRHRYDLQFTDAGRKTLTPAGGQNFQGETVACRMTRINRGIPGPEENEGASAGTVWYARLLSGDVLIPVRMELETQLGTVDAYLAEIHGRGVDLMLMR